METAAASDHPPAFRRRLRRGLILLGLLAVCGWCSRFAYLRLTLRPTPRPEYWEARLAEIDPPGPGAVSEARGVGVLASRPFESDPAVVAVKGFDESELLRGRWDVSRPDMAAADAVFRSTAFVQARADLKTVLESGWREPIALVSAAGRSLVPDRAWARWLIAHSRWRRDSACDADEIAEDWRLTLRLGRQVCRGPVTINWLTAMAIQNLAAWEILIACHEGFRGIEVHAFIRSLRELVGPVADPRPLLEGERLCMHAAIEFVYVREGGNWIDVSELVGMWNLSHGGPGKPSRIWNLGSPLFHSLATARRNVERVVAAHEACRDLVSCASLEAVEQASSKGLNITILDGEVYWPAGLDAPAFARVLGLYYRSWCGLEAAIATLAIHEYQRRTGAYPASLEQLVPELLDSIPLDYADRKPLRYRRTAGGYLLYSVGINGKDDGGRFKPDRPDDFNESPDVVFSEIRRGEVSR